MGRTEVFSAISQTCVTRRLLRPPEWLNLLGKGTGQSRLWFMWETQTRVYNKKSAVLLLTSCVLNQVIYYLPTSASRFLLNNVSGKSKQTRGKMSNLQKGTKP